MVALARVRRTALKSCCGALVGNVQMPGSEPVAGIDDGLMKNTGIEPRPRRLFIPISVGLFFIGLGALAVVVGMTTWLGIRSEDYFAEIVKVRDFKGAVVELRTSVQAAETSQRGYLLTGNEIYLGPFAMEKSRANRNLSILSSVIPADSPQSFSLAQLKSIVQEKFDEMNETIDLKRAQLDAEVLAIMKTNKGKRLTDEANVYFSGMVTYADQRLASASEEQIRNFRLLQAASFIAGLVILLVAAIAAVMVRRHTAAIAGSRDEVNALNIDLERRVSERTAHLAELNEEVRRFAYIVTHDLRAPLVNIMGFTREIEESIKVVPPLLDAQTAASPDRDSTPAVANARSAIHQDIPEAISFIRSSAQRMDALINAILKLSREGQRKLRYERVDLASLIRTTVVDAKHRLTECGGHVEFALAASEVVSDRLSLEQVLANLVDNAIKYRSPERPLIVVLTSGFNSNGRIFLSVADNGRGIAEADKERVFELFRRAGVQDQPGEGIGLAHVRTLVRNLGGDITLATEFGRGTTFAISLPLLEVEEERGSS